MPNAVVIGAGLAGPAAALSLARYGYSVRVMERRAPNDLWSDSTIAISTKNMSSLEVLGVACPYLPAGSKAVGVTVTPDMTTCELDEWTTKFNIVVWGELHEALVEAGQRAGVTYAWRQNGTIPSADLVVHAQGIKYAAHHSTFTYAYQVYRGTIFEDAEPRWMAIHDSQKQFVLNVGSTGRQQTWMLYLHAPQPPVLATEFVAGERRTQLMRQVEETLPRQFAELITRTRGQIQTSPVGDWTMPKLLHWAGADYDDPEHVLHVDLGDAVAPVRPHTTAGANLGIAEALSLSQLPLHQWVERSRIHRAYEIENGKRLGLTWMGK